MIWYIEPVITLQDAAYTKVLFQLPEVLDSFAQPANRDAFPKWVDFLDSFLSQVSISAEKGDQLKSVYLEVKAECCVPRC